MRMAYYFGAVAALVIPALLATAVTGIWHAGGEAHLTLGLFTAIFTVAVHTLLIVFMIVTGRVLREAIKSRDLDAGFLSELNAFFGKKAAYPAAILSAFAVVAAAVLGYAQRGFGVSAGVHMLAGLGTLLLNVWSLPIEWRALRANQDLLDRVTVELDRLDDAGVPANEIPEESWAGPRTRWLIFAAAWWAPYVYWGVIEHRGDFAQVSLHPWLEFSLIGLLAAAVVRGPEANGAPEASDAQDGDSADR